MGRLPYLLLLILVLNCGRTYGGPSEAARVPNHPSAQTPEPLWDLWIRFHEAELCQGMNAVFVFHDAAVEAWCPVRDQDSLEKLSAMTRALPPQFAAELYTSREILEKPSGSDPPPSLWNNQELRLYLQDPFARNSVVDAGRVGIRTRDEPVNDMFLKQRIAMYAKQTLDWNRRLRELGMELPALAEGLTHAPATVRARLAAVCRAHTRELDKHAERLSQNLVQALPSGKRKSSVKIRESRSQKPHEIARQISAAAQSASRNIYRFIHPQEHTVDLPELREPGLLESLSALRKLAARFDQAVKRAR
jgi:hypothetical protein